MSRRRRVLVVGRLGAQVSAALDRKGYEIRNADVGSAEDFVRTWRPQIVLVDPSLVRDRHAFAEHARWSSAVLIVAFSNKALDADAYTAFDVCLVNPIDPEELHAVLMAWPARTKTTKGPES